MTLLVLGWKPRYEEILPRIGSNVIVVLGDAERDLYGAVARSAAPVIDLADKADLGRLIPALTRMGLGRAITHVFTDQETPLVPAALLAEHYGARGISVSAAVLARDKFLQKQAVARAGVAVPGYRLLPPDDGARDAALRESSYPAVIKPVSAHGTRHVTIVDDAAAARVALARVEPFLPDTEAFLIEELVDGREMHADGVISDGEVTFLSVSRYHRNILESRPTATIASTVLAPDAEAGQYRAAQAMAQAAASAIGLRDAGFHLEYFDTVGGPIFSELAARTGGSWVTDAAQEKFGYDIRRAAMLAAVGQAPGGAAAPRPGSIGWSYLPLPAGRIESMPGAEELTRLPGVLRATVDVKHIRSSGAHPRRGGFLLVEADDEPGVRDRVAEAITWFTKGVCVTAGES